MSEFNPKDAYNVDDRQLVADSLDVRLQEDEQFAVTFVNECLAGSFDEVGITRWWIRARSALGGKTPQEAWANDRMKVVTLAKSAVGPGV